MTTEARRDARTAIHQELQRLIGRDLPDEVKREIWRIEKLAAAEDEGEALSKIHDEALDLSKGSIDREVREILSLVMSIARYRMDVRSRQERDKHHK